jgi:hypothetical protein
MVTFHRSQTALQAVQGTPRLADLANRAMDSRQRLNAILPLLPIALRAAVQPGPVEADQWCLIVANNAAAAKLRQMAPALAAHLCTQGWQVNAIRVKVQSKQTR